VFDRSFMSKYLKVRGGLLVEQGLLDFEHCGFDHWEISPRCVALVGKGHSSPRVLSMELLGRQCSQRDCIRTLRLVLGFALRILRRVRLMFRFQLRVLSFLSLDLSLCLGLLGLLGSPCCFLGSFLCCPLLVGGLFRGFSRCLFCPARFALLVRGAFRGPRGSG